MSLLRPCFDVILACNATHFIPQFFIQQFRTIMDKPEATRKEIAAAIKGYGHFAAVFIEFILHSVTNKCHQENIFYSLLCQNIKDVGCVGESCFL